MVLSREDTTVLAGMDPRFVEEWQGPHLVTWNEGGHCRAFQVAETLEEDAEHYRFRDTRGRTYELRPLTLDLYEKHVRRHTMGQKKYDRLEDLLAAMRLDW